MSWLHHILDFILNVFVTEFVAVVFGLIFVQGIQRIWDRWRFGRWRVILLKDGKEILNRQVSTGKAKEVLGEDAELAVFLKGIISPYDMLHCDLLMEGRQIGLLVEDKEARHFIVDLDKNPPQKAASNQPKRI